MTDLRQAVALALSDGEKPNGWHLTKADAVLAALSASIGEDVVEAAAKVLVPFSYGAFELQRDQDGNRVQPVGQPNARALAAARAISSIIALAARDATLEEAASRIRALMQSWEDFDDYYAMRDAANEAVGEVLALKAAQANG